MSTSSHVPTRGSMHLDLRFEGREDRLNQVIYLVDKDFLETYGLQLVAGNKTERPQMHGTPREYLISAQTAPEAGYSSPLEAVGKRVDLDQDRGQIVGVVKDINIYSLHRQPYSISYVVAPIRNHDWLSLRHSAKPVGNDRPYPKNVAGYHSLLSFGLFFS